MEGSSRAAEKEKSRGKRAIQQHCVSFGSVSFCLVRLCCRCRFVLNFGFLKQCVGPGLSDFILFYAFGNNIVQSQLHIITTSLVSLVLYSCTPFGSDRIGSYFVWIFGVLVFGQPSTPTRLENECILHSEVKLHATNVRTLTSFYIQNTATVLCAAPIQQCGDNMPR